MNLPDISQFLETAVIAGGETQRKAGKTMQLQYSNSNQPNRNLRTIRNEKVD